jgi:guanylate kinase
VYVFISPPSLDALRSRLVNRGTESDESLATRLASAAAEIDYARQPGSYDLVIVNDDVERAYRILEDVAIRDKLDGGDKLPDFDSSSSSH